MSHGLTLTAASLVLWYAPLDNLETYLQANARIARPGQSANKVQVMHLVASPSDRKIYKRLKNKERIQGVLLDMFDE
jgi:SNF2 family DNA or RNA helicase